MSNPLTYQDNTTQAVDKDISHKTVTLSNQSHATIILASGESQRLGQPKQLLTQHGVPLICKSLKLALSTHPQSVLVVIPATLPQIESELKMCILNTLLSEDILRIHVITNSQPQLGMGHSLYLAIDALKKQSQYTGHLFTRSPSTSYPKHVLIMVVDQILLDDSHLDTLLDKITGEGKENCKKYETPNPNPFVVASSYPSGFYYNEEQNDEKNDQNYDEKTNKQSQTRNFITGTPIAIDCDLLLSWQTQLNGSNEKQFKKDKGLRHLIRALPSNQLQTVINPKLSYDIDTPEQLKFARSQGWLDNSN